MTILVAAVRYSSTMNEWLDATVFKRRTNGQVRQNFSPAMIYHEILSSVMVEILGS